MKTVQDNLVDSASRHTVYMLRYARSTYTRHSHLIDEAVADISMQLALRGTADNTLTKKRLEAVLESIKDTSHDLYSGLTAGVNGDLKELAAYESTIQIEMLEDAYPIQMSFTKVSAAQVHSAAMSRPFQGKILKDWWKDQEYSVRAAYKSAVRLGFVQGESIPQIVSRVRGVGNMTKRYAETIIRTAINHTAQVARTKLADANANVFKNDIWSSTLDGRTTAECRARDGKTYKRGSGPFPPIHQGCRSTRIPQTKSWKELGFEGLDENDKLSKRPFVADKRRVKDIPKSERDGIVGQTTAKTYNDWLKTQKRPFIDDVLGKKKAKLYMDGDVTLDRFVNRNGREYTLKELEIREKKSFIKANVEIDKG